MQFVKTFYNLKHPNAMQHFLFLFFVISRFAPILYIYTRIQTHTQQKVPNYDDPSFKFFVAVSITSTKIISNLSATHTFRDDKNPKCLKHILSNSELIYPSRQICFVTFLIQNRIRNVANQIVGLKTISLNIHKILIEIYTCHLTCFKIRM